MDLGISGKRALVCAASQGLGKACAMALAQEGVAVTIVARRPDVLAEAAEEMRRATGAPVTEVAADVTTDAGRQAALDACPEPDILVNNAGGPPAGDFRDWGAEEWSAALQANMLTPIWLIKATVDGMIARRFGRIVNITSMAVKAPVATLGLSNGARSGLTGFVAGLARQTVRHNVTINNLLPGLFETARLVHYKAAAAAAAGLAVDAFVEKQLADHPAGRYGDPAEFGQACAYLCGAGAGYITGQNFLVDGGLYPGTF